MSDTPRFVDRVFDLNHQAMGDESDWDEHGKAMMDLAREADEIVRELAAARAENEKLREKNNLLHKALLSAEDFIITRSRQRAALDAARKP